MTDFASLLVPDRGQKAHLIHLVDTGSFEAWARGRSPEDRALIEAHRFDGKTGFAFVLLPRGNGFELVSAVKNAAELSPWCLAKLAESLPEGTYRLASGEPGKAALGWLLAQHRFDAYRSKSDEAERGPRVLVTGEPAKIEETVRLAEATALVRDLVNTPAADLGAAEIEQAVRDQAARLGAKVQVTSGEALAEGHPLIAAVGAAATEERAPRLVELEWGDPSHPRLAIVGKGVCFDSGGLDLKPASGMRIMKKDMGGAAHALALATLIIAGKVPVRLHLLIPAVENAVSGAAYRPGDIVRSRKGLTVEIDNTDAEGRLILADALAKAVEGEPELIVDFATLTGAARIALGPDLPATFANRDDLAAELEAAARDVEDPLWRMPLWDPYDEML
jgi:leucyl aminopeptidase